MRGKSKYQEIIDYFNEHIQNGDLPPKTQIMTEMEICKAFDTTRPTANKALQILANDGIITRTRGKGSFVNNTYVRKNIRKASSFTADMETLGMKAGSKLIEFTTLSYKDVPLIASMLQLSEDGQMYYFVRLRTGDSKPIAISYTYINADMFPDFNPSVLSGSFYEYCTNHGITMSKASYQMSATLPTAEQKKWLKLKDGDEVALLKNHHITYSIDGKPYEYIDTYYIGNRYIYQFDTVNSHRK